MTLFRSLLLLAFLLLGGTAAQAQDFPKLTGRVVDAASLLDLTQQSALDQKLAALEQQSGHQLVVATIPNLQGYDIADYGYRLGRAWGIGQKEDNDGALLIVAPNERKVRIEVGYGLEGTLTDALSSVIINQDIIPHFRDGDFAGGIAAGTDALITQLELPPDQARARLADAERQAKEKKSSGNTGAAIFWIIILLVFVLPAIFSSMRGGRRYRRGGMPIIIWGPGGGWGGGSGGDWGGGGGGGGFSGGGGSFGGGGASGGW